MRSICFLLFGFLVWHAFRSEPQIVDACLRAFVVSSVVLAAYAVIGVTAVPAFVSFVRGHGWNPLYEASIGLKETGSAAAMMVFVAAYCAIRYSGAIRLLSVVLIAELFAVILVTGSRAGLAGLAPAVAAAWFLLSIRMRSSRIFVGGLAVIVAGIASLVQFLIHIKQNRYQYEGEQDALFPYWMVDAPRQGIWTKTLEVSEPYRLTGFGINAINDAPDADKWNPLSGTVYVPAHPHNWIVELLAETGVLGLTAMLVCITLFTVILVRRYLKDGHAAVLAAIGIWTAYWSSGLFNFSYWSSWWQVAFYVLMAVCLAAGFRRDGHSAVGAAAVETEGRG